MNYEMNIMGELLRGLPPLYLKKILGDYGRKRAKSSQHTKTRPVGRVFKSWLTCRLFLKEFPSTRCLSDSVHKDSPAS
jgi:hypothetical protein